MKNENNNKWCISEDGESYDGDFFETENEAVMDYFKHQPDATGVHVGQALMVTSEMVVDEDAILEHMGEAAYENYGEWAEDWWSNIVADKELNKDVKEAIVKLLKKHKQEPSFWTILNAKWVERGLL